MAIKRDGADRSDFRDADIKNVGTLDVDAIASDSATSIAVNLGTDAGDDLLVATNALVVEGDNKRVGVNTTSPDRRLDVEDSTNFPQARFTHTSGTHYTDLYTTSNGTFRVTPSARTMQLDTGDTNGGNLQFTKNGGTVSGAVSWDTGDQDVTLFSNADLFLGAGGSSAKMTIDNGGNVGIGTTDPSSTLHLASATSNLPSLKLENSNADATGATVAFVNSTASLAASDVVGNLIWNASTQSGGNDDFCAITGSVGPVSGDETDGSSAGALAFKVANGDTNGTSALTTAMTISGKQTYNGLTSVQIDGSRLQFSHGRHFARNQVTGMFVDDGDNVVSLNAGITIPPGAIILNTCAVVVTASNLGTHAVNIHLSTTPTLSTDVAMSGTDTVELLGAGASGTDSTGSASASDIDLTAAAGTSWVNRDTIRLGTSGNYYAYMCNAGTGNGTTNASGATQLAIMIEYIGKTQ